MNICWSEIKNKIFRYTKRTFEEESIMVSDSEINECINMFYNILKFRLNYILLDGIDREMIEALQTSCCDNIGSLKDLRTIATLVDSFLKRILLITQMKKYNDIQDRGTKQLFIFTQIEPNYTMQKPRMTNLEVEKYKGTPNGMYLFAKTYFYRNEVHSSNDLLDEEVISYLRYIISFYIYVIYRLKDKLLKINDTFSKVPTIKMDVEEDRLLYDFMNFGRSQNILKNQIIQSYILYQIKNNESITKKQLVASVVEFSRNSLNERSVIRQIEKLKDKIELLSNGIVCLKEEEKSRLSSVYANYNERMADFEQHVEDLIDHYSLSVTTTEFNQLLRTFFENNFNTDIIEATNDLILGEIDGIDNFFDKLRSIGCPQNKEKILFQDILKICETNDIIIRLSLGKLFSNIANPEAYETYVSMTSRCVYVDTQLVLYILCNNICDIIECPDYDTIRYKIAKELLELHDNKTIHLQFSSHYLREVIYHIRQAFLLIPLVENIKEGDSLRISSNVFYCYYCYLSKENKLPYGIETFRDFMCLAFNFEEDMVYDHSFWTIAEGYIKDILVRDMGISVVQPPFWKDEDIQIASDIYRNTLKDMCIEKVDSTLRNDVIMGWILFNHSVAEADPFFLTWDTTFSNFKKTYISKIKRKPYLYWHLFSPTKFINHIDLINFKIDVSKITDDLMSAIETNEYKNTTKHFIDQINKILDIPGLDGSKRNRYFNTISKEIFNDNEFPCEVDAIYAEPDSDIKKFADTFDKLIDRLRDEKDIQVYLQNEEFFNFILKQVQEYSKKKSSNIELFDSVLNKMKDYDEH